MSLPPRMTFEQQEQRLRESECVSAGLEIGLAEGAIRERERIIKLPFIHEGWGGKHRDDCVTCHNIELIKEENSKGTNE